MTFKVYLLGKTECMTVVDYRIKSAEMMYWLSRQGITYATEDSTDWHGLISAIIFTESEHAIFFKLKFGL